MIRYQEMYTAMLEMILTNGIEELNERTGHKVKICAWPTHLTIQRDGTMPLITNRRTNPVISAAEVAWWLSGSRDISFLEKYTQAWSAFKEEDGLIHSSYGYRWQTTFGRNQLDLAIKELKTNPSSRQVYLSSWDPRTDGMGTTIQKSIPCPIGFVFNIINDKLNMTLFLRSSDFFLGLPYDVMWASLLQDSIGKELGKSVGYLGVSIAHAHIYDVHYDVAWQSLKEPRVDPRFTPILWSKSEIQYSPDGYVNNMKKLWSTAKKHTFCAKVELVK